MLQSYHHPSVFLCFSLPPPLENRRQMSHWHDHESRPCLWLWNLDKIQFFKNPNFPQKHGIGGKNGRVVNEQIFKLKKKIKISLYSLQKHGCFEETGPSRIISTMLLCKVLLWKAEFKNAIRICHLPEQFQGSIELNRVSGKLQKTVPNPHHH